MVDVGQSTSVKLVAVPDQDARPYYLPLQTDPVSSDTNLPELKAYRPHLGPELPLTSEVTTKMHRTRELLARGYARSLALHLGFNTDHDLASLPSLPDGGPAIYALYGEPGKGKSTFGALVSILWKTPAVISFDPYSPHHAESYLQHLDRSRLGSDLFGIIDQVIAAVGETRNQPKPATTPAIPTIRSQMDRLAAAYLQCHNQPILLVDMPGRHPDRPLDIYDYWAAHCPDRTDMLEILKPADMASILYGYLSHFADFFETAKLVATGNSQILDLALSQAASPVKGRCP